jgi:hypothetical protein
MAFFLGGQSCGIVEGGEVGCWNLSPNLEPPSGNGFVQVASTVRLICALKANGHVDCIGPQTDDWDSDAKPYPSNIRFEEISVGQDFVCGITTAQDVECWGGSNPGTTTVPAGLKAITLKDNPE